MKVLITGSDGFIGSHLTEMMVRLGFNVRAFAIYNSLGSWGWLDNCHDDIRGQFEVILGDVRDLDSIRDAMKGCDAVLHLAALVAIPYSYIAPESYIDTNIKGTLNILRAARDLGIRKVVHTSTSEVYGTARYVPIDESHPIQAQSPYAATKIAADQLAHSFYTSFGLPVTIVRPFNTYGPRQSSRAIIPTIISQISSGMREIKLGAVSPTRDFSYVNDTVSGFIAALRSEQGVGETINLGSSFEISIKDTAELIAELMNVKIDIISDQLRLRPKNSEVERLYSDNSRAKELLGWEPNFGGKDGFLRGLNETLKWFSLEKNIRRYRYGSYEI